MNSFSSAPSALSDQQPSVAANPSAAAYALAELGRAAAEAAHEINNHLHVISGCAQLIPVHRDLGLWQKVADDLTTLNREIDQCVALTDGISRFIPSFATPAASPLGPQLAAIIDFSSRLNSFDDLELRLELDADAAVRHVAIAPFQVRQLVFCALRVLAAPALDSHPRPARIVLSTTTGPSSVELLFSAENRSDDAGSGTTELAATGALPAFDRGAMDLDTFHQLCRSLGVTPREPFGAPGSSTDASPAMILELPLADPPTYPIDSIELQS